MARQQLETAAENLRTASDATTDEASSRLDDLADQLDDLAARESGPDHGRLARIQSALADLEDGVSTEAGEDIDDADDAINGYRETIEGGV
ncbi:DUF7553 family protein [Halorientalis sp.]|jgi:hypothetical protein|uniref:DUF7553 family protein n=1 Tax=Halorientalis sp. TaxID=1931229 RepID=UPI00262F20B4|nr:hypothetical protein [Halorientalis sp.]